MPPTRLIDELFGSVSFSVSIAVGDASFNSINRYYMGWKSFLNCYWKYWFSHGLKFTFWSELL